MKGYMIRKVYVIICDKCSEDIVERGDEPATRAEAERWAREHEQVWHKGAR